MICYKAVKIIDGKILPLVHPTIGVEYKLNEWTKPLFIGSSIICSESYVDAKKWVEDFGGFVFEAIAGPKTKNPIFIGSDNLITTFIKDSLLNGTLNEYDFLVKSIARNKDSMYKHTIFLNEIKLLRQVD